jgi:hypothetical protein
MEVKPTWTICGQILTSADKRTMYLFAVYSGEENSYTPAAPQGVKSRESSLKISNWQLAGKPKTF